MYSKALPAVLGLFGFAAADETGDPNYEEFGACYAHRRPAGERDGKNWTPSSMQAQYSDEYHQQYWAGYDFNKPAADIVADAREYVLKCCEANPYLYEGDDDEEDIMENSETDELYIQFRAQEIAVERLCKNKLGNQFDKDYQASLRRSGSGVTSEVGGQEAAEAAKVVMAAANGLRKFRNLKTMVMKMQPANITTFGRYCYYGCWCLPAGQHNLASGFGSPVDAIDEVCKEFALCYKCLDIDFAGTCNPATQSYAWGRVKTNGVIVDVTCLNDPANSNKAKCARYVCECDRILATGFAMYHWVHNNSLHIWGNFDRLANCFPRGGSYKQDACCGAYGTASEEFNDGKFRVGYRRPYSTLNPSVACCNDVFYYNYTEEECCDNAGDITIVGTGECAGLGGSTVAPDA